MKRLTAFGIIAIMALSACSGSTSRMRDLYDPEAGPEEFAVAPSKPLEIPQDLASLPSPTPGGKNRVDPTPQADAIALLGGKAQPDTDSSTIGAGDQALFEYASRFGFDPNIRVDLAERDERFRKNNARWSSFKLFRVDRYNQAYRFETLDAFKEVQRWRLMGVGTPSMPSR